MLKRKLTGSDIESDYETADEVEESGDRNRFVTTTSKHKRIERGGEVGRDDQGQRIENVTNKARKLGTKCEVVGCEKHAMGFNENDKRQRVCIAHGAKNRKKPCEVPGCEKYVQGKKNDGLGQRVCNFHGAKHKNKQCEVPGCENQVVRKNNQGQRVCMLHGAKKIKPRCSVPGCGKQSQGKNDQGERACASHGAKYRHKQTQNQTNK